MRPIKPEVKKAYMQIAIALLHNHVIEGGEIGVDTTLNLPKVLIESGKRVGSSGDQDLDRDLIELVDAVLSKYELDDLHYNYQIKNSNGEAYDANFKSWWGDEMILCFAIAFAIGDDKGVTSV